MPEVSDRSHMQEVTYDESSKTAFITYRNGYSYRVKGLPKFHYENMLKAHSPGRYFHSRIRGTFPVERIR